MPSCDQPAGGERVLDGPEVLRRLEAKDMTPEGALRVVCEAVDLYDRERKERGKQAGPLGMLGPSVYQYLAQDRSAFEDFRPYRTAAVAQGMVRSEGPVGRALRALEAHGFISLRKVGYSFSYKLLVPEAALLSLVEWLSDPRLNEESRELAAQVAAVLEEMRRPR
jgi:hypothetical protein